MLAGIILTALLAFTLTWLDWMRELRNSEKNTQSTNSSLPKQAPVNLRANLKGHLGQSVQGTAYLIRRDNEFIIEAVVEHLPDPKTGKIYKLWLLRGGDEPKYFYVGVLTKFTEKMAPNYYYYIFLKKSVYAENLTHYDAAAITLDAAEENEPIDFIASGKLQ